MKKTSGKRIHAAGVLASGIALSSLRLLLHIPASAAEPPAQYADEILAVQRGSASVQEWADGTLPGQSGLSAPDWYAMALSAHYHTDLTAYGNYVQSELRAGTTTNPVSLERLALTLTACTGPDPVCTEVLDSSAGGLGIMSRIFALHLLNNGVQSDTYTNAALAEELVSLQAPDGGWSLQGDRGDADVTAMTLQALAPYRDVPQVAPAVQSALNYLADTQLSSGAYQSYGAENAESTAQVWLALSCLGIDALHDSRFIADGNTVLDGILQFRVSEGQYAHIKNGSVSSLATVQVFLAMTASDMLQSGEGSFYLFHGASPAWQQKTPAVTQPTAPVQTAARTPQGTAAAPENRQGAVPQTGTSGTSGTAQSGSTSAAGSTAQTSAGSTAASAETTAGSTDQAETASGTVRTTAPAEPVRSDREKYPYRIPLTAASAAVFGGIAVFFVVRKQKSPKTYLTIAAGFCAVTALIWVIRVESPDQFYTPEQHTGGGTVTMEIRCDVILGMPGSEKYPADGIIMPVTEFSIEPGENALTLLYDAVKADQLQIEVDGVSGDAVETAYVRGIASLYEFDFGDLSGWTYTVNGERPSVGCGSCILHDGDKVAWIYTINL